MKQFVFLISTGCKTREHFVEATGMTDAINRVKMLSDELKDQSQGDVKIKFKGVIY
ncbi:hypothetical protein [Metabacillus fastidiosus]|uniref:Uncharacterized protein n=1 Tax=Metabacillus fastidiosus TaxID=1458 RepID=A0ABU6NT58_9BACI|nr:hypothetical protein [Metabacillus fastidiosus]MED4400186.1 hypothetical protein [Metabacillus fastidiosus]MED4455104.1 hypothetical protein [Metabacillus fastidiosus]MED4462692.1 hypothetical protein [Metabacillus fastidiosus]